MNQVRGEAEAKIGSLSIVMVITMDSLAQLSAATGYPTLPELYHRLHGTELSTVLLAIELFTVRGEVDGKKLGKEEAVSQAKVRLTMDDIHDLQGPFDTLLAALLRKTEGAPQGNGQSAQSG